MSNGHATTNQTTAVPSGVDAFAVSRAQDATFRCVYNFQRLWKWLGMLESEWLRDQLESKPIQTPIYISGLARSGSTKLLEIVASVPSVATHRYRDAITVFCPVWMESATSRANQDATPIERSHGDRVMVTPDSPEAIEEALWSSFFPHVHRSGRSHVLDAETENAAFEQFYCDHIQKLLHVRGRQRYASKGNYNVARLRYIAKLLSSSVFVVPVRDPRWHIASLRKQHHLFCAAAKVHPRSVRYLDRVGHYEFGVHRHAIDFGDGVASEVESLWNAGEEVRGWARYWNSVYKWLRQQCLADPQLRQRVLFVRYEDLCVETSDTLTKLFSHCDLSDVESIIARYEGQLNLPDYYQASFTSSELAAIRDEAGELAAEFGYDMESTDPSIVTGRELQDTLPF